ncbi:MAG: hypothetical protein KAS32_25675, partial [Candidatus Peribacteraceae bacterium]|nr:hypothetical protein [Candidatus Peribacteraceae bacterium]
EFKVFSTEIQGQLNNLKNEHQAKISEIDIEKTERVKPLSDELLIVRPKRDSAQDTLLELEVILENSSIELKTIQDQLKQECPTCFTCGQDIKDESLNKVMTEFDGKKKTFGELKDKKAKSKEEFDIQQSRAKEILKETDVIVVDINKKKEEVDAWKEESKTKLENSYNSRKVTFDAEEAKFNELLTNLQSTIKGHLDELSVLFEDKMSDETEKINITHLKKITEMREKLSGITDSLADIKSKIEDFNEAKEYVDGLKSNIASTEATIKSNAENFVKQVTQKEVLLASHQKEIADTRVKVDAIDAKTTDARRKLDIIDFWKKGFSNTGIKAIVLDEAKPILNEKARELSALTDCIRVTFDTQKQIGSGELRNKFSVMAIQTRNLTDDREDFSGGEGKLVDIITLLALRHLLEKMHDVRFNLMLFDEVLDALDPANVEIILNVFRRMSDDYCVALITHTLREAIEANEVLSL